MDTGLSANTHYGQWNGRFSLRLPEDSRVPLPIIGVGRALRQGGAHDDAPRYDQSRSGRPLPVRGPSGTLDRVFFSGGWGCRWTRGLRAENADAIGIEPVHTPSGLCGLPASGRAGRPDERSSTHRALGLDPFLDAAIDRGVEHARALLAPGRLAHHLFGRRGRADAGKDRPALRARSRRSWSDRRRRSRSSGTGRTCRCRRPPPATPPSMPSRAHASSNGAVAGFHRMALGLSGSGVSTSTRRVSMMRLRSFSLGPPSAEWRPLTTADAAATESW